MTIKQIKLLFININEKRIEMDTKNEQKNPLDNSPMPKRAMLFVNPGLHQELKIMAASSVRPLYDLTNEAIACYLNDKKEEEA